MQEAEREARKAAKAAEKAAKEAAKAARVRLPPPCIAAAAACVGGCAAQLFRAWRGPWPLMSGVTPATTSPPQAAQRGQKQSVATQPDADDPLAAHCGDTELVQSAAQTGRVWTDVGQLLPGLAGQTVLVRARMHTVRGKGKSAFLVLRQATATVQAAMFVDDVNVSKGMVKYASAIPRESIVDVEGKLVAAEAPIEACSQSQVSVRREWPWRNSCAGALWACEHGCSVTRLRAVVVGGAASDGHPRGEPCRSPAV